MQRRIELFYTLSYANLVSKAFWSSIPTAEPLVFDTPSKNDPTICNGSVSSINGSFIELKLWGWCDGTPPNERAYRFYSVHEYGHTFRAKINNVCSATTCQSWQEAEADMLALGVNGMEAFRGVSPGSGCADGDVETQFGTDNFLPDDTIQDDCCPEVHDHANIFVGVHLEQLLDLGWRDALFRVFEPVDEISDSTQWLRTTGVDGYYAEAIESDGEAWARRAFEMSTTVNFSHHDESSLSGWQWTDQLPGAGYPMFPSIVRHPVVDPSFTTIPLPHGSNTPLPSYAIEHVHDFDYSWHHLDAGVAYEVRTTIPTGSAVDTVLLAVQLDANNAGAEVQIAKNDDRQTTLLDCVAPTCAPCPQASWGAGNLSSCFVLTPQASGDFAFVVRAFNEGSTGVYGFEMRPMDDAGGGAFGSNEAIATARPLAIGDDFVLGAWQTVGDLDHYRVHMPMVAMPAGWQLRVETCGSLPAAGESDATALWVSRQSNPNTVTAFASGNGAAGCGSLAGSSVTIPLSAADVGQNFSIMIHENGLDARGSYLVRAQLLDGAGNVRTFDVDGDSQADNVMTGTPVPIDTGVWGGSVAGTFEEDLTGLNNDEDWYTC